MSSRRQFLAACGSVGGIALAGCSGSLFTDGTELLSHSFQPGVDELGEDRIQVIFDEEDGEVHVTGFAYYGSSSCDKLVVESVAYDDNADRLTVTVSHDEKLLSFGCTGDMSGTDYQVTARFAGGLPETVRVVERNEGGEVQTKTVERDQRQSNGTSD